MDAATPIANIATAFDSDIDYHNVTHSTDLDFNYSHEIHYCNYYSSVDFLIRGIWMYVGYPILIFGSVGHLIVIVLLLFNKRMRSLPLSIFLLTMSVAGLMALNVGVLPTIIEYQTCHNERLNQRTELGCQLLVAAIHYFLQLYSWMEACLAIERMCAVRWALTYQTMTTRRNNAVITGVIVILLMAINGIHFKIYGTSHQYCDVEDQKLFEIYQYVHCSVYILLPVAVMLPANAITVHTMYKSSMKNASEVKKAKPVAIMMMILNGIFVVTTTPKLVGHYELLNQVGYEAAQVAWVVCKLMMYLGCSMTFLVYVAVAARFRKAFPRHLVAGNTVIHAVLEVMSSVGGNARGKVEDSSAARRAETTIEDRANCWASATTDGKV